MSYKYLARQPIVDMNRQLFAYEMLYRVSEENSFPSEADSDAATRNLLCSIQTDFNLKELTGGKRAFINLTRQMCMSDIILLLAADTFVIEILEDAEVDRPFLEQLAWLKEQGYTFALDDYAGQPQFEEIIPYMEIIKVDFQRCNDQQRVEIARRFAGKKQLLAEKVQTEHDFSLAKRCGYSLAQGYYLKRPVVMRAESISISTVTHMRLWKEVNKIEPEFDKMATIILNDAGMTMRLLNKSNTLRFFRGNKIDSVQHALVRMGSEETKRWIILILLQDCLQGENDEYIRLALERAKFLEYIFVEMGAKDRASNAYITGMFSVFSGDKSRVREVLSEMLLPDEVQSALLREEGLMGEMLTYIKQYEEGEWSVPDSLCEAYGINQQRLVALYRKAVNHADEAFRVAV